MNKNFPRSSLIPYTLRTSDAVCNHKHHFKNVLREVIGYLELRAKDDRERFVWFSVGHLTEHCNRYERDAYKERAVKYAIAYLRRKHFISKRLERKRGGVLREGVIVTPHDALFQRTKLQCEFVGRKSPGRWRRDPATRSWYWISKETL
jgi:hypothetical protein